jgi:phage gp37-like protein
MDQPGVSFDLAGTRMVAARIRAAAGQLVETVRLEDGEPAPVDLWQCVSPVSAAYEAWSGELRRIADALDALSGRLDRAVTATEVAEAEIAARLRRIPEGCSHDGGLRAAC